MIGLKDQCFGVEVEMTGITREQAATALAAYFVTDARYVGGAYDKWCVTDRDGKEWTVMSDSSIHGEQKIGSGYRATGDYRYRVEMVTPKLTYAELPKLQECVRQVRHAGAKANSSCGIHVHVDAANHNRQSLKNLIGIMYSKEDILFKALQVNESRASRWCQKVREPMLKQARRLSSDETRDLTQLENIWYEGDNGSADHYNWTRYYADRVFTTAVVSYPELTHIGEDKDFTPVIEKALELGGYNEDKPFTGINGGGTVMTGFGHGAVLGVADQVIEAVKSGAIRHFFLVGGCDGARPGRNYYTEFVKQTPADTVVLTLACGKYRFNDLDLGTIGGLPRLMDVGQCNDAYGAVKIALALAEAFGCGVNDLPLSMVLSWYEQKAVCILLTLLHLGIKNIRLGPTLPAFVSPNVLNYLVENFGIAPITTPEEDLKQLLK